MNAGITLTIMTMSGMLMSAGGHPAGGGFMLPPAATRTLDNGMRLLAMEYHELPLVDFQIVIGAGAAHDPPGKEGLADLVADLLRKGTITRSARDIAETVDFVGGSLDTGAEPDATRITAEFLVKDADLGLDVIADMLMRPAFTPGEVERLKGEIIGELQAVKENPGLIASRRFVELLYGAHPYGHPTSGWEKSVAGIASNDVRAFYDAHYRPGRAIAVAVGDFEAARMLDLMQARFGGWSGAPATPVEIPAPTPPRRRTIYLIDKPDATQSQIRIGGVGIHRGDDHYIALQVANAILGGGFTSRLVEEIRVNRGLSYGASSRFYAYVRPGPFLISTFTKSESTQETVKVALDVLEKFREKGPTAEEVDKARRYLKGAFAIGHQPPDALASALAEIAFYRLPADYYDTYLDRLAAVSAEDLARIAPEKFPSDKLNIVVLGNAEAIRKGLESIGNVVSAPLTEP